MDNSVVGDLLRPGAIGHLLVIIAFTAALLAFISFLLSSINKEEAISLQWKKLGRIAFFVHAGSIIGIFVTLYLLIVTQHYEYYYVWRHSSAELPWYYKISSFWEGQEGSFLLWLFWHVVLGIILIYTAKQWESPVMTTFSLVQVFLTSMVIGIFFLGYKVGSSPFILIRDVMVNEPRFQLNPDFVPEQGNGLNPLLQNYWMVIHPPTLFLGFASTLVPFCFAVAGLWKGKFTEW
ncbi:MAG: cytochrome c biogenesis protein CcsA, partial [Bacteroidetes bacterium]|nr:cytochrome c biogenesis protein CcsA [Bacteroidota bacterium]